MKNSQGQKEPWLLATSLPKSFAFAKNVVKYYKGRMQIEESFRDVKSHRFGLSLNYHYTHSVKRLQVLLLIATLAFRVLWLIGIAAIQTKKHFQFQANSIRHKTILSVIFIGLQVIKDARIKFTSVEILEAWRHFCGLQLHHELE